MKANFLKTDKAVPPVTMQQWLFISCAFSCLLLMVRAIATSYLTYFFLLWNLFLGIIPYLISHRLPASIYILGKRTRLWVMLSVWLLFIPNSFYILTDLFHLDKFDAAPKWFDLLLIFSFAWNGWLLGIISVRRIEYILTETYGKKFSFAIVFMVMWLNAFGIYIGRYLRFNSWDIVMQPFSLFNEITAILFHPFSNKMEWSMITVYTIFMTLFYSTMKKLGSEFSQNR